MPDYRCLTACILFVSCIAIGIPALAQTTPATPPGFIAPIVDAVGKQVGDAQFTAQPGGGVLIVVTVAGFPSGVHGVHIHELGSCNSTRDPQGAEIPFGAAGGHFDPAATGHHLGPAGSGHAGDLPILIVDPPGSGRLTHFAQNLQLSGPNTIVGRTIVIHANADNYTDSPPLGGSGGRIACGQIAARR